MGEEKAGEEKKGVKKEDEKKSEKKEEEEEPQEIVLKVDMHCEACARKIARALKGFPGVEEVSADSKASKVVVKGKAGAADPVKVWERIQKKSGRKVEIILPLPKPPPLENKTPPNHEEGQEEVEKQPPPKETTAVLKVGMHCEACAQVLQKRIRKIQGVESVTTDLASNQVTVKGVIDPTKLVDLVYKRTRKQASLVKGEENKEEGKKEDGKKDSEEQDMKSEIKRSEYWPPKYATEYAYAPEFFSDENPNACSVM